jgi:hypothetical protein
LIATVAHGNQFSFGTKPLILLAPTMRDVKVNTVGITTHMSMSTPSGSSPLSTTPISLTIEQLAPNTAVLIDRYDPMIDGDFITFYDVAFIDQRGQKQLIRTAIGPGGPSAKFVAVTWGRAGGETSSARDLFLPTIRQRRIDRLRPRSSRSVPPCRRLRR